MRRTSLVLFAFALVLVVTVRQPPVQATSPYNAYFGDLHAHSTISRDAHPLNKATYNDLCPYARDTMHLDFCAMTDHSDDITSSEWNTVKSLAAQYYNPGVFTTFIAEEWSSSTGHKNVYLPGDVAPPGPWSPADQNYHTPSQLWTASDAYGALINPHHSQGGPAATDWSYSNDIHQRLVEVCSKWGSSEYDNADPIITSAVVKGNHSVQEALALGQKLGFVGGTDSHSSLCGYLDANEARIFGVILPYSNIVAV